MKSKAFVLFIFLLCIGTVNAFENFDQAFNQMRHRYSLGHYKRTIAIAPIALKFCKNPEQKFKVLYYKGLALDALRNFWQAEQVFAKAANIENIPKSSKLQAHYNQIRSQYANKHFISALANAEKYSQFSGKPSILQMHILLKAIESARQLNRKEKALSLAEKMAESAAPDSAWHYRGIIMEIQILCLMKNYEKAEKLMNKVDIKKLPLPMRAEFLTWAGFCYEKDNKPEAASKLYSWAYGKYSDYYSGLAALRHANLLSLDAENYEKTALLYAKVLKFRRAHPNHKSQAIYKIACIYKEHGKPELALRYLSQIDDLKYPDVYWLSKIYNMHGDILYKKGKTKEAKKYFQACLKLSKPEPASKLYAGEIIAQMEEKKELPAKK